MSETGTSRTLRQKMRRFLAPTLVFGLLAFIIYIFGALLVPFVLALIIVYLIEPVVKRLHRLRIRGVTLPRWVAVIIVYLCFFSVVSVFSITVVPPLARELSSLASEAPQFFDELRREHIPSLNRHIQSLIQNMLPTELSDAHVEEAQDDVHKAVDRAASMASLLGALTPEEREMFLMGGTDVVIENPVEEAAQPVALRLRNDPETGDWLVMVEDLELVRKPDADGTYVIQSPVEGQEQVGHGFQFDLEQSFDDTLIDLVKRSGEGVTQILSFGESIASWILSAFVAIVLTFMVAAFISIDLPGIMEYFRGIIPEGARGTYDELLRQLDTGLSGVVRGQLMICMVNGTLTGVGLLLFNVKFALVLAGVAGILSLIPIFGTIISTIPCVAIALTQGFYLALLVLGWILMIHFIEANILNPKIIGSHAHIHPVIVIFALLAGEHAYGLIGALLAVPVASVFLTLFKYALSRSVESPATPEEGAT